MSSGANGGEDTAQVVPQGLREKKKKATIQIIPNVIRTHPWVMSWFAKYSVGPSKMLRPLSLQMAAVDRSDIGSKVPAYSRSTVLSQASCA